MRIPLLLKSRELARRLLVITVGLAAITFGLSTVPSAATPAAIPLVATIPVKQIPPNNGRMIPNHVDGDADFAGHGPDVQADANILGLFPGSTSLSIGLCMNAVETKPDRTRVEGCVDFLVFQAPLDHCIESVSNGIFEELNYIDSDHSDDIFGPQIPNSFVQTWDVIGDTKGKEAGTRTGIRITTKPFTVTTAPC